MVECDLAKVEVAGSNPVSRSNFDDGAFVNAPLSCTRSRTRLAGSVTRGPYARSTPPASVGIPVVAAPPGGPDSVSASPLTPFRPLG